MAFNGEQKHFAAQQPARGVTRSVAESLSSTSGSFIHNALPTSFAASTYGLSSTDTFTQLPVMRAIPAIAEPQAAPAPYFAPAQAYAMSKFSEQSRPFGGLDSLSAKPSLVESVITAEQVAQPMPVFFSRATAFLSMLRFQPLLQALTEACARNPNLVYQVHTPQDENQISGELSRAGYAFRIAMNIFQYKEAGQLLVEVQLLCGDRFEFSGYFHDLCDELGQGVVHSRFSQRVRDMSKQFPLSPRRPAVDSAVAQLASMAQAQECDIAREGALSLALLSLESPLPLSDAITNAIVQGSKSEDWEVSRCTALLTLNLSMSESAATAMSSDSMLESMQRILSSEHTSHSVETKRSICAALLNLAQKHSSRLMNHKAFRQMINGDSAVSSDPVVRDSLAAIRTRLAAAH